MTWIPIFKVVSLDFETDILILKKIMHSFEKKIQFENGFKFSPEAHFAMGWWFYEIFVKIEFFKKLVQTEHFSNPKIKDERDIKDLIQIQIKKKGSKAKIKIHTKKSIFQKYWTWLLK